MHETVKKVPLDVQTLPSKNIRPRYAVIKRSLDMQKDGSSVGVCFGRFVNDRHRYLIGIQFKRAMSV